MQVDDALVDAHLEPVPGLGALAARGLPGGDLQGLGGHPDGSLDLEVLLLGALDQVGADLLQALDGAGGQGDANAVNHLVLGGAAFAILVAGLENLKKQKIVVRWCAILQSVFCIQQAFLVDLCPTGH